MKKRKGPIRATKNKKSLKENTRRVFEEAQGRLLEHAYAKGFYAGIESMGGVFVPGLGLVVGLLDESKPLPAAFAMPGFIPPLTEKS